MMHIRLAGSDTKTIGTAEIVDRGMGERAQRKWQKHISNREWISYRHIMQTQMLELQVPILGS